MQKFQMMFALEKGQSNLNEQKIYPLTGDILEEAEDMELAELRRRAIENGIPAEELDNMDW